MEFAGLNIEYLGAATLAFTILWMWNRDIRADLRKEREYSKEVALLYQDSMLTSIDAFTQTTAALGSMKDALIRLEDAINRVDGQNLP